MMAATIDYKEGIMDWSKVSKIQHDGFVVFKYNGIYVGKTYDVHNLQCTEIVLGNITRLPKDTTTGLLKLGVMVDNLADDLVLIKRFFYNDEDCAIKYWYSISKIYNLIKED